MPFALSEVSINHRKIYRTQTTTKSLREFTEYLNLFNLCKSYISTILLQQQLNRKANPGKPYVFFYVIAFVIM